ncbi:MAG: 4Fe-4S binding protein [Parasporobacterium sp.]|nr:4Fe-4S binding protein [Parasporobacterium sp.]
MKRKIIKIDQEKCNGCGACANACHEGAIDMIDSKAHLVRENYCDGLGDCLPACPADAISFEEREAPAYDEAAVLAAKAQKSAAAAVPSGCPGAATREMGRVMPVPAVAEAGTATSVSGHSGCPGAAAREISNDAPAVMSLAHPAFKPVSQLTNWPVQIKLAPLTAPYFKGAKLLIAADCTAYCYASMHEDFVKGHKVLIGCPKLDSIDYSEKLTEIIKNNDIRSVSIVRMEVPCCSGLEAAAKRALKNSGKFIPWQVTVISMDGRILD